MVGIGGQISRMGVRVRGKITRSKITKVNFKFFSTVPCIDESRLMGKSRQVSRMGVRGGGKITS